MNPDMTKLHHIKAALRESIEIANKATEGPWTWRSRYSDSAEVIEPRVWLGESSALPQEKPHHNAAFISHARTMTPLACKALLTAIEGLEWVFDYTDWCADGAPDANTHDKVCNEIASKAKTALLSITSEWPDV